MPSFRRPINRHRLLSRTYIPNQASHIKPTIEKIEKWNVDDLLEWIKQRQPDLLEDDDLKKLKDARVSGQAFLISAGNVEFFEKRCKLPPGTSVILANLAREIAGGEIAGIKSKLFFHTMHTT
jgi:hypothetical protein